MSWERRLRDLILAGGALSAIACGALEKSSGDTCCNANGDPCCPIAYCSGGVGPNGSRYLACEQSRMQCEAMNGFYYDQADGSFDCMPGQMGPLDVGPGPIDAAFDDAGPVVIVGCCNGHADPCCSTCESTITLPDGSRGCGAFVRPTADAGPTDAEPADSGTTDAGTGCGEAGDAGDDAHD
jgi:hypothetical protein